jgi:hypothetical protein
VNFPTEIYSREFTPLITPLAKNRTEEIRKMIHEKDAKMDSVSPIPIHSAAEKDKNELPFQNECPAMDRANAGIICRGV